VAKPGPVPPDLEELVRAAGLSDRAAARARLGDLFRDPAEMIALARISGLLGDLLAACPDPDAALLHLGRFVRVRGSRLDLYRTFLDHPALLDRFVRVVASSRYLADILVRSPDHLEILSDAEILSRPRERSALRKDFRRVARLAATEEERLGAVRRLHRRELLRIGAADLLGFQGLGDVARQVSDLADAFVDECLSTVGGRRAGLVVLGLGKWGGRELNYSSDIDVVFLAPSSGDLAEATRLAQRLVRALGEPTYEGVVYRVDLRLRPYGSEGTLVATPRMFEDYLRRKSRPAERQAMLKARAAAGRVEAGRRFLAKVAPLVLRDAPAARREVRHLKSRIEAQLRARGQSEGHVKLAPGGIRDVEFLVQAFQLESGAERPRILGGNTLEALAGLEREGLLGPDDAQALREAYVFLRTVEHRMQLMENQQVHRLPRKEDDLRRLGRTLGFAGPEADRRLLDAYDAHARRVRALFDRLLSRRPAAASDPRELLERVRRPGDVEVRAERHDARRWTVAVAARGAAALLPLSAGLLSARRADIASGDFTLAEGKALAVFEVSAERTSWSRFRDRLAELAALAPEIARERLIDEVSAALGPAEADRLLPVRIDVRNDPGQGETELHIRSGDTPGFLFELSTALAALNLEVRRAVIRTLDDEVYDTFWVTDLQGRRIADGRPVEELRAAAALVKQFMHLLPRSPNPAQALRQFTALLHQMFRRRQWVRELRDLESPGVLATIATLMGVSRFLWEDFLLLQHENLFPVVRNLPALDRRRPKAALARELARRTARPGDAVERLNEFKDREMFRIDLRHITRRSDFPELMSSLTDLAELVLSRAAELCLGKKRPGPWTIGALGKFGGRELGLASDLDLVVVYEDDSDAETMTAFVKELREAFRARREGSFGIDLRLRPWGDSGAWASSLEGFERYYSEEGPARPFERMALVKLRPAAGDAALGARLLSARDRFVYSARPLDEENLLHLRKRQAAELVPPGETDAKYSPGGLVDVEYFIQALQIEAGHRDPSVRVPGTLAAIDLLVRGGALRPALGRELSAAYLFLRRLIDALRVVRGNAKDSRVPATPLPEFAWLARRLDYASPASLEAEIRQRMSFARNLWSGRGEAEDR
jgi:glutamate-ammonia-ligase adenylyltransferase